MDKSQPPETFGVFKPVGHTVISYRSAASLQAGVDNLVAQGFASADIVRYSPGAMVALVDAERRRIISIADLPERVDWRARSVARLVALRDRLAKGQDDV